MTRPVTMRSVTLLFAAFAAGSVFAASGTVSRLQGSLKIRGASLVDAPAGEPTDTHASFAIEGPAAKALYGAIKGAAVEDECLGDGSLRKQAGSLSCIRSADGAKYECDFAIDLRTQKIEPGSVC